MSSTPTIDVDPVHRAFALNRAYLATKHRTPWLLVGLGLDLGVALWLDSFLADHDADARLLAPAAGLGLGVIALVFVSGQAARSHPAASPAVPATGRPPPSSS